MKHQVINLVIPMNRISSILGLVFLVAKEGQHVFDMGYLANWLLCIHILGLGLCFADYSEGLDLAIVEPRRFAVTFQANVFRNDAMELR